MLDAAVHPPALRPLGPVLSLLPSERLGWIAEKHVAYLDDRIHKIDRLTDYLAHCEHVKSERDEFVRFVDDWARRPDPPLEEYLREYATRFRGVRERVEALCDRVLHDGSLWHDRQAFLTFWRNFAYINEVDSLHGMFLTSGRWYVNVMLPVVKELVFCSLPSEDVGTAADRNIMAYYVARRVITPRFAEVPATYDHAMERRFAKLFMPVLQHYDRKLLFLFEVFAALPDREFAGIQGFVDSVHANASRYAGLLEMGVYPPFGWHEFHASRRARRAALDFGTATAPLLQQVPPALASRAHLALDCFAVLKDYELNYNNYNYKGRFGLISKYQYWMTLTHIPPDWQQEFLDAILLDNFFPALAVVERALAPERTA